MLQGTSTTGARRPMAEAIFGTHRGYNTKETLNFVSNKFGASSLGIQKRNLTYPFVLGSSPVSRRRKVMVVSENECRAVNVATLKSTYSSRRMRGDLEACLYRRSCSSPITAMLHNSRSFFRSLIFTIVPHNRFREKQPLFVLQEEQIVCAADRRVSAPRNGQLSNALNTPGAKQVDYLLRRVKLLTFHQSKDPFCTSLTAF